MDQSQQSETPMRRVAITEFTQSRSTWFRQILEGIEEYVAVHRTWEVRLVNADEKQPELLADWGIDGAIVFATAVAHLDSWRKLGAKLVNVASRHRYQDIPTVAADNVAIGRMAAQHLIDLGFERLAMAFLTGHEAAISRQKGFAEVAGDRSDKLMMHELPRRSDTSRLARVRMTEERIENWLKQLPLPIGIMGWNDSCAAQIVQACRRLGISVPEQVAVIGCDDDEVWCGLCTPTLSSIQPGSRQLGFKSAELLQDLMEGRQPPTPSQLLPPIGIHHRESTDTVACEDPHVARAMHFIRENTSQRLTVQQLVDHLGISRRNLERRFQDKLGRSPHDEIDRNRVSRAKELLQRTDLALESVAERSGYRDANHLIRSLSEVLGETPGQFRNRFRVVG